MSKSAPMPLVIDLDGTLITHDTLLIQLSQAIRTSPSLFFQASLLLLIGKKALAKSILANRLGPVSYENLPTNREVLRLANKAARNGADVFLATASHWKNAESASLTLLNSSNYIGSTESVNLAGEVKGRTLNEMFGHKGFDYIGNSRADRRVAAFARNYVEVKPNRTRAKDLWQSLRPTHWVKNILVALPIFTTGDFGNSAAWVDISLLFIFLSAAASAGYLVNDLLDLDGDLKTSSRRIRPIAQGTVHLGLVLGTIVLLTTSSVLGSLLLLNTVAFQVVLIYLASSLTYSFLGKNLVGLDLVWLGYLYSLRVYGGMVVAGFPLSIWLLSLCFLAFTSMAAAKRVAELMSLSHKGALHGKPYTTSDTVTLQIYGVASALASVIVLMIFISGRANEFYSANPILLFCAVPGVAYWFINLWLSIGRGQVSSDPTFWAMRNRTSLVVAITTAGVWSIANAIQ